jgi:hypothetical protein
MAAPGFSMAVGSLLNGIWETENSVCHFAHIEWHCWVIR